MVLFFLYNNRYYTRLKVLISKWNFLSVSREIYFRGDFFIFINKCITYNMRLYNSSLYVGRYFVFYVV